MRAIPSGEGPERFPPLSPPKTTDLGGDGGGVAGGGRNKPPGSVWRKEKGRVGEEGAGAGSGCCACRATPPDATGVHVTSLRGRPLLTAASVAALSRQAGWRDRGYLSRHYTWRDQTGYTVQIKSVAG